MSSECDKCGEHAMDCKCETGSVQINNEYRGKCAICDKYLGDSLSIYASTPNSLRHLYEKQQAHLDCYIDLCVENQLNKRGLL